MKRIRFFFLSLCLLLTSLPILAEDRLVNINIADAATMAKALKGVGDAKARAIISYREKMGAFKSVDELVNVKGIGESLIAKNRSLIVIE